MLQITLPIWSDRNLTPFISKSYLDDSIFLATTAQTFQTVLFRTNCNLLSSIQLYFYSFKSNSAITRIFQLISSNLNLFPISLPYFPCSLKWSSTVFRKSTLGSSILNHVPVSLQFYLYDSGFPPINAQIFQLIWFKINCYLPFCLKLFLCNLKWLSTNSRKFQFIWFEKNHVLFSFQLFLYDFKFPLTFTRIFQIISFKMNLNLLFYSKLYLYNF
jgi:hypothetical protein